MWDSKFGELGSRQLIFVAAAADLSEPQGQLAAVHAATLRAAKTKHVGSLVCRTAELF